MSHTTIKQINKIEYNKKFRDRFDQRSWILPPPSHASIQSISIITLNYATNSRSSETNHQRRKNKGNEQTKASEKQGGEQSKRTTNGMEGRKQSR
jgi:hypothetical protein